MLKFGRAEAAFTNQAVIANVEANTWKPQALHVLSEGALGRTWFSHCWGVVGEGGNQGGQG